MELEKDKQNRDQRKTVKKLEPQTLNGAFISRNIEEAGGV